MGLFTPAPSPAPPAPAGPPPIAEVLGGALAESAYARSIFSDAVDALIGANLALDDVEMRTSSEIDRLTQQQEEATRQRRENLATIEKLSALIG